MKSRKRQPGDKPLKRGSVPQSLPSKRGMGGSRDSISLLQAYCGPLDLGMRTPAKAGFELFVWWCFGGVPVALLHPLKGVNTRPLDHTPEGKPLDKEQNRSATRVNERPHFEQQSFQTVLGSLGRTWGESHVFPQASIMLVASRVPTAD